MVENLCVHYGEEIVTLGEETYYDFPSFEKLSGNYHKHECINRCGHCLVFVAGKRVEKHLRELGFGYRAKYIHQTAKLLLEKEDDMWLYNLREKPYDECRRELLTLTGVGPKVRTRRKLGLRRCSVNTLQVADCVCLMSLDKHDAIPVDTHVLQVARKFYGIKTDSKTVSEKTYQQIR